MTDGFYWYEPNPIADDRIPAYQGPRCIRIVGKCFYEFGTRIVFRRERYNGVFYGPLTLERVRVI